MLTSCSLVQGRDIARAQIRNYRREHCCHHSPANQNIYIYIFKLNLYTRTATSQIVVLTVLHTNARIHNLMKENLSWICYVDSDIEDFTKTI